MMQGSKTIMALLAAGLLLAAATLTMAQEPALQPSAAQAALVGTAFTYQGRLTDGNGPVNGTCDFVFDLYDEAGSGSPPTGGTLLGTEARPGESLTDGLFTVQLDFGGAFFGEARWLEIEVDCGSGAATLSPRQRISPAPYALALPGLWTQQNMTSTNVIGGYWGNTVAEGAVGATVSGGGHSGYPNVVYGKYGTVGGGHNNTVQAKFATIGGGGSNNASGAMATISGGQDNVTGSDHATVAGGKENFASGVGSTVGGGLDNTAILSYTTVSGGQYNSATGQHAAVGGGQDNAASAPYATVGGGGPCYVGIWDQDLSNRATGDYSTISGGGGNSVDDIGATVGGGLANRSGGTAATVSGGELNEASAPFATIPGGFAARASRYGEMSYASGGFLQPGAFSHIADYAVAQTSVFVLRNTTTGGGSTVELFLDGSSQRLTIAERRTMSFDILVVCRSADGRSGGYQIRGVIVNYGGATALVGTPAVDILGADDATWNVWVEADDGHDALVIKVSTPKFGSPEVRWVASARTVEVQTYSLGAD
jgi:hypothetical protein